MEHVLEKIHEINENLVNHTKEEGGLGLLNGRMGLCIYFYHLAKETEEEAYLEVAENLVGEVYDKIGEAQLPMDFENGLSGIAWGISYLVNSGFVDADLNDTLSELDDKIFKYLEEQKGKLPTNVRNGLIGYLFYCLNRLESSLKSDDMSNSYIFQKLGASLVNQLGQLIEEEKLQDREPQLFSIFWDLPLLMIVLAKSKKLQVNSTKVERILDYLLPSLISLFPNLHSNRLYLLLGIESVLKEFENSRLSKHALFLKGKIDVETIFNTECKNLNICVLDGVSGLRLIAKKLTKITGNDFFLPSDELFYHKINESVCWGDAEFYSYFKKNIGLVSGLSGIGLALLEVLKSSKKPRNC